MWQCIRHILCMPFLGLVRPDAAIPRQFIDGMGVDDIMQNFMWGAGREASRRMREITDDVRAHDATKTHDATKDVVEDIVETIVAPDQVQPEVVLVSEKENEEEVKPEKRAKTREVVASKRKHRPLPKAEEQKQTAEKVAINDKTKQETPVSSNLPLNKPIRASSYSAVEIHGFFGLIDDGSDVTGRQLIVHVPSWIKGYFMDIQQGDVIHVYSVDGKVGGRLNVLATGRHKYYPPGRRVTTCTICVPEDQWIDFA